MANSVIHAAVMAGILAGLPLVRVRLVVFDTAVVDLSEHVSDPVEVLMSVQLGGGTNIGQAVRYCEQLVSQPRRTVLVLVTDFCEGADPRSLVATCRRLREAGVKLLGLAALDEAGEPLVRRADGRPPRRGGHGDRRADARAARPLAGRRHESERNMNAEDARPAATNPRQLRRGGLDRAGQQGPRSPGRKRTWKPAA